MDEMKNMVVLKDLPSNIVEEAYVVLKPNKNFKHNLIKEQNSNNERISQDYVVKEAELVISNYLSKIEDKKIIKKSEIEKIQKKYKKLKKASVILAGILVLDIVMSLI